MLSSAFDRCLKYTGLSQPKRRRPVEGSMTNHMSLLADDSLQQKVSFYTAKSRPSSLGRQVYHNTHLYHTEKISHLIFVDQIPLG